MRYFNFDRLIRKYSRDFTVVVKNEGAYDAKGDWIEGATQEVKMTGAVMALAENKVNNSNGAYTMKDKALYMTGPIDRALLGAEIIFCGDTYVIESIIESADAEFTGVYHYVLKWVSVFDGKEASQDD